MESSRNTNPLCSVIIPVFNNCFYTRLCLDALHRTRETNPPYELILVDNGSTDDTAAVLAEFSADLSQVVSNSTNRGFAPGINQGAGVARGEYLVLLNNDVLVEPACLQALVRAASSDQDIGAVGALLFYPDGTIQHAGVVFAHDRHPSHAFAGYPADWAEARVMREYQAVTGACMLIRKDLFQSLGGLDESFCNSFEDIDFCLRVRKAGKRVVFCPDALACHFESSTPGRFLRDDRNLSLLLHRWGEVITPDLDPSRQHLQAASGPASLMRLEFDALADRVNRLTTENAHLRRLVASVPGRPDDLSYEEVDLVYMPSRPPSTVSGTVVMVPVAVTNQGTLGWPAGNLRLSYHWRRADTFECVVWDGLRAAMDEDFGPGQAISVSVPVLMPADPGRYILEWDGVQEGVAWMSERGVEPYRQSVLVYPAAGFVGRIDGLPSLLTAGSNVEVSALLEGCDSPEIFRELLMAWRWIGLDGQGHYGPCSLPPAAVFLGSEKGVSLQFKAWTPRRLGRYKLELGYWLPGGSWAPLETLGGQLGVIARPKHSVANSEEQGQVVDDAGEGAARSLEEANNWQRLAEEAAYELARTQRGRVSEIEGRLAAEQRRVAELTDLVDRLRNGRLVRLLAMFHRR